MAYSYNNKRPCSLVILAILYCLLPLALEADISLTPADGGYYCSGSNTDSNLTVSVTGDPSAPPYHCPCNEDGSFGHLILDPAAPPEYTWSGDAQGTGSTATVGTYTWGTKKATVSVKYHWTCDSDPSVSVDSTETAQATYYVFTPLAFTNPGLDLCADAGAPTSVGPGQGGSDEGYTFTSSDSSVAQVDSGTGNITSVGMAGSTTITLTDSSGCTATCIVKVEDLTIAGPSTVGVGNWITLSVSGRSGVSWSASNSDVNLYASSNGYDELVQGVTAGSVTITATVNGCTGSCEVTVQPDSPPTVSVTSSKLYLQADQNPSDTTTFTGSGGSSPYTYYSSDPTVASIDSSSGAATAGVVGTTSITAKDVNGVISNPITLTVYALTTTALAATPTDKTRKTLGVGEQTQCSTNPPISGLVWNLTNASELGSINPTSGLYTAPDVASSSEEITVTGFSGLSANVTFNVIAPQSITFVGPTGSGNVVPVHVHGYCNAGFVGDLVIQPTNVSFSNIQVEEEQAYTTATGYFYTPGGWDNNKPHETAPVPNTIDDNNISDLYDQTLSGWSSKYPSPYPFIGGSVDFANGIPVDYEVTNVGVWHTNFYTQYAVAVAWNNGSGRCANTKNGSTAVCDPSDANEGEEWINPDFHYFP